MQINVQQFNAIVAKCTVEEMYRIILFKITFY